MRDCKWVNRTGTCVLLSLFSCVAVAGTIRHDRLDSMYTDLSAGYASTSFIAVGSGAGSGVLIAPDWIITAAHVAADAQTTDDILVLFGADPISELIDGTGTLYSVDQIRFHPRWTGHAEDGYDLALLHLSSPASDITPAIRYRGSSEIGHVGTYTGYGTTGDGQSGYDASSFGIRRAGNNIIDSDATRIRSELNSDEAAAQLLLADFDDPPTGNGYTKSTRNPLGSATALDLEYSLAPGDSGGGLFITDGNATYLAGIHSFIDALPPPDGDGTLDATYSDLSGSTRLSGISNDWIDSVVPEPSGLALLLGGVMVVSAPRRRAR
jgi:secreted trypsin-like serine protease